VTATGVQSWLKRWCEREGIHPTFTPHDLRRTAATRMNSIGVAPHVVEKILNHSVQGLMATYNRADYAKERMDAQEKWARSLVHLTTATKNSTAKLSTKK
jgi:integrase